MLFVFIFEDALNRIEKIIGEHSLEQKKTKPRLSFNPKLALIGPGTTGPRCKGYERGCDSWNISGLESLANFVSSCQKTWCKEPKELNERLKQIQFQQKFDCFCGNMLQHNWPHVPLELCF